MGWGLGCNERRTRAHCALGLSTDRRLLFLLWWQAADAVRGAARRTSEPTAPETLARAESALSLSLTHSSLVIRSRAMCDELMCENDG